MIARRSVWSHPEIQELAESFVAVADEVQRLQTGESPDCRWFQSLAEQGHYAGRIQPTATRQGIYFATPSGQFLNSLNSTRPEQVASAMRKALALWNDLQPVTQKKDRQGPDFVGHTSRKEQEYPEQGLVWQIYSRDLPRPASEDRTDWRSSAWNQDFAWVRRTELKDLLPAEFKTGFSQKLPDTILRRLASAHLVDNVRGQTTPYLPQQVLVAEWSVEVVDEKDGLMELRYRGRTLTLAEGRWPVNGHQDSANPESQQRGVETILLGRGRFHLATETFLEFDLVFVGTRRGGTQYNGRNDDLSPAPIGFFMQVADDQPQNRVAPELFYAYDW